VEFGGKLVEVGGDAWSSVNPLMQLITQKLDVAISNNTFDGNGMVDRNVLGLHSIHALVNAKPHLIGKTGIYTSKGWMTLSQDVLSHSLLSEF